MPVSGKTRNLISPFKLTKKKQNKKTNSIRASNNSNQKGLIKRQTAGNLAGQHYCCLISQGDNLKNYSILMTALKRSC